MFKVFALFLFALFVSTNSAPAPNPQYAIAPAYSGYSAYSSPYVYSGYAASPYSVGYSGLGYGYSSYPYAYV